MEARKLLSSSCFKDIEIIQRNNYSKNYSYFPISGDLANIIATTAISIISITICVVTILIVWRYYRQIART